jgi:hypothetical protein
MYLAGLLALLHSLLNEQYTHGVARKINEHNMEMRSWNTKVHSLEMVCNRRIQSSYRRRCRRKLFYSAGEYTRLQMHRPTRIHNRHV